LSIRKATAGDFRTFSKRSLALRAPTADEPTAIGDRKPVTFVTMAPNYQTFYAVEITTLCLAVLCFTLRLSNRYVKKIITFVSNQSHKTPESVSLQLGRTH